MCWNTGSWTLVRFEEPVNFPQPLAREDEKPGQSARGSPWPDLSARKARPDLAAQAAEREVSMAHSSLRTNFPATKERPPSPAGREGRPETNFLHTSTQSTWDVAMEGWGWGCPGHFSQSPSHSSEAEPDKGVISPSLGFLV